MPINQALCLLNIHQGRATWPISGFCHSEQVLYAQNSTETQVASEQHNTFLGFFAGKFISSGEATEAGPSAQANIIASEQVKAPVWGCRCWKFWGLSWSTRVGVGLDVHGVRLMTGLLQVRQAQSKYYKICNLWKSTHSKRWTWDNANIWQTMTQSPNPDAGYSQAKSDK